METLRLDQTLLTAIKQRLPQLEQLLKSMEADYEDRLYRYYHQSFKVYGLQEYTRHAAALFSGIGAQIGRPFCDEFQIILTEGTGIEFTLEHNQDWPRHTRPQVEAFLHAKYFTEMMVRYGRELEAAPRLLPSGWAAILSLYNLR